ncbi:hypothetical protein BU16DRAFT_531231 [Lophium mytilinum]|uniref:Uncharacterized protein n=1 Tax=Lophium mytilinum TaxID=390894 RepID=A0A6A6QBH9_9PEZI|nr:hypothetical protein BU16DRAFT_531231 [Lophium mytilinum]
MLSNHPIRRGGRGLIPYKGLEQALEPTNRAPSSHDPTHTGVPNPASPFHAHYTYLRGHPRTATPAATEIPHQHHRTPSTAPSAPLCRPRDRAKTRCHMGNYRG